MTRKQSKLEIALDALRATNGDVVAAKTRAAIRISTRTWYAAIQEFDQQTHGFIGDQEALDWTWDRIGSFKPKHSVLFSRPAPACE